MITREFTTNKIINPIKSMGKSTASLYQLAYVF
jgi:hypothetical protein